MLGASLELQNKYFLRGLGKIKILFKNKLKSLSIELLRNMV